MAQLTEPLSPIAAWTDATLPSLEADVIVVGSGAAGLSAALNAQREGADVVMLEKAATLGGTTIKSSAYAWYPNHAGVRTGGHVDEKDDAMRYMARLSAPESYDPHSPTLGLPAWRHALLEAFYDNASTAVEALNDAGVASTSLPDFPDYFSYLPENRTPYGRTHRPVTRDGEPAGADEMIRQGAEAIEANGGRILTEHAVAQALVDDEGGVVGLVAMHDGAPVVVRARRGVVFASGGFAASALRRADHLAAPVLGTCAVPTNTGDFIDIAQALGSPLRNMTYPWMTLMTLEDAIAHDPEVKSLFHPPGDSMIFVNGEGRRTMNEKAPYNEMAQMFQRWDVRTASYPELFQFMVWDQACQDLHGNERRANPIPPSGAQAPHVVSGATLDELASALRERVERLIEHAPRLRMGDDFAENLKAAVARFSDHARQGGDPDFERGDRPIELAFNEMFTGGTRDERNPVLFPFADEGPYYATIIVPGALDTKGGPQINTRAEVVRVDGTPIPGLYGAGNCVASPAGKSYWAAGATIGPAVTFGYLAGRHAATAPVREVRTGVAA
jgi:succinate dehydrogenase/fumarate reductase flavoprotein subunit